MPEPINERDFYNTLWNYFSQHANQRIQLINFYIILETFLFAGLFAIVKDVSTEQTPMYKLICCLISLASIFFSAVFYNLDVRTKQMIHICETSIKNFENKYGNEFGSYLMIFNQESLISPLLKKWNILPVSYSISFKILFIFFSLVGTVCFICFSCFYCVDQSIMEIISNFIFQ